jgi:prevent-host-death family protein
MITVSIKEAKSKFEWLVDQAERGVPVTITKWKKPVAQLQRFREFDRQRAVAE